MLLLNDRQLKVHTDKQLLMSELAIALGPEIPTRNKAFRPVVRVVEQFNGMPHVHAVYRDSYVV